MSRNTFLLLLILIVQSNTGYCNIILPKLISDGAILQRDQELTIWGWSSPEENIDLVFKNKSYKTIADKKGNWEFKLPPQTAGGPHQMTFTGNNKIVLKDILFGEVWLCSGQSNMELTMHRLKDTYPDIVKTYKNSNIRQFLVPDKYDFNKTHQDLESGNWLNASPENILNFSGVAFFFAKELYDKYQVPIGLINAALGGSPVEAWMSEDALKAFPIPYQEMQRFKDENLIKNIEQKDKQRQQEWYSKLNENDQGFFKGMEWFLETTQDEDWDNTEVPSFWADGKLGALNGVVWFRKKVIVPQNMAGLESRLWLGRSVDQDHVYVNGEFVGMTGYQYPPRKYTIPKGLLKEGENTIAVRLINEKGKGGFIKDKPYFLDNENGKIDLEGIWKYKLGTKMEPLKSQTFIRWKPGGLYNRMISPLTKYKIKGVIWYQGESNTADPRSYSETFPALIRNWRDKWEVENFPFLFVQLANFMEPTETPVESNWAELRQAQLKTLSLTNTGMVVAIDLGEWNDIHPLNKKAVATRLAECAYRIAYKEKKTNFSPIPLKHHFYSKKVLVKFTEKSLTSKDNSALVHFEISNDGIKFYNAKAKIKGSKVVIWHDEINRPIAIRYGWSNNPFKVNLYSKNGLPVSPFEIRK